MIDAVRAYRLIAEINEGRWIVSNPDGTLPQNIPPEVDLILRQLNEGREE